MKVLQVLLFVIGLSILATGQNVSEHSEKSTLIGNVFDETGAVVSRAKITFTNKAGKIGEALTNEEGVFRFELNEGKYKIEFYKEGFATLNFENYRVAFKSKMQLDVALDVMGVDPCHDPAACMSVPIKKSEPSVPSSKISTRPKIEDMKKKELIHKDRKINR